MGNQAEGYDAYDAYRASLDAMCGPYTLEDMPGIRIDLRGITAYARGEGKKVCDLTDGEMAPFVLNATVDEMRRKSIQLKAKNN